MHSSKLCYMHSAGSVAMIQAKVRPEENAGKAGSWLAGRLAASAGGGGRSGQEHVAELGAVRQPAQLVVVGQVCGAAQREGGRERGA